jgi:heme exporter protein A
VSARLEGRDLACMRGVSTLFRGVSFAVAPGEWVAVRGPNGSGKTTLLRCIAGLTRPERGAVLWDGEPIAATRARFHASLLYAGHLAGLKDDFDAEENLRCALRLRGVAVPDPAIRSALADVGLERHRRLPARRLSAGQRRRIGLARLILDPASLWALDEPLTALDDAGQRLFERLLERHLATGGLALVATHHDLALAPSRVLGMGA